MKIPVLRNVVTAAQIFFYSQLKSFSGSEDYWINRYKVGGNSGNGSYGLLAQFKAEILNGFVREKEIISVIEYGCGDGNQLRLSDYPSFIGFDVSPEAIAQCQDIFSNDLNKTFKLMETYTNDRAQLTLSLDVIYHLIEDEIYNSYMERLFDSSTKFVIIYSSNTEKQPRFKPPHIKHRMFSNWIRENRPNWRLIKQIPNRYPPTNDNQTGSFADFYIFEKS